MDFLELYILTKIHYLLSAYCIHTRAWHCARPWWGPVRPSGAGVAHNMQSSVANKHLTRVYSHTQWQQAINIVTQNNTEWSWNSHKSKTHQMLVSIRISKNCKRQSWHHSLRTTLQAIGWGGLIAHSHMCWTYLLIPKYVPSCNLATWPTLQPRAI